ncbi:MAG TPA: inorganic phosphate transporter, partial [Chloroflexota bacterium]|nr:inorganic phosphate transporter [Chloroflexota bacterium]
HAISGTILGVGMIRGPRNVGWQVAGNIVTAWILTIPACFAMGFLIMLVVAGLASLGVPIPGVL